MTIYRRSITSIAAVCFAMFVGCNNTALSPATLVPDTATVRRDEQRRLLGKLDREDKVAALALAQRLSDEGDPMAITYLGARYLDGNGVPKNRVKADALFEQASASGGAEIDFLIGKTFAYCRCEGNKGAAFEWYSRAASRGHLQATYDLGGMYELGFGVKSDPSKAFAQFLNAAQRGYVPAMMKVAECYSKGIGVNPNEALAQQWRSKASASAVMQSLPQK